LGEANRVFLFPHSFRTEYERALAIGHKWFESRWAHQHLSLKFKPLVSALPPLWSPGSWSRSRFRPLKVLTAPGCRSKDTCLSACRSSSPRCRTIPWAI